MAKTPAQLKEEDLYTLDSRPAPRIYKNPKAQAQSIINLNRKRYENFDPYPNSIPINKENPGGSPDVTGPDRIYALYQHALDNNLDFARVLAHDREYFPNRTPNTLEFENERFDLTPGSSGGDHWRKATQKDLDDYAKNGDRFGEIKDGWRHISTGTRYGDDIFRLLEKENFK